MEEKKDDQKPNSPLSKDSSQGPEDFKYSFLAWKNPKDIKDIPKSFFESDYYKERPFLADQDELVYIRTIAATFYNYSVCWRFMKNNSFHDLITIEKNYRAMSPETQEMVKEFMEPRIDQLREAIQKNYQLLIKIISEYEILFNWESLVSFK